jgi:hypothetical protein
MRTSWDNQFHSRTPKHKVKDLKVCDGGVLIQLLSFWTLFIVMFFYLKH